MPRSTCRALGWRHLGATYDMIRSGVEIGGALGEMTDAETSDLEAIEATIDECLDWVRTGERVL